MPSGNSTRFVFSCAIAVAVAFLLAANTHAQQPIKQEPRITFDYGDAALLTGFALDTASSSGKRELNPLFRNAGGRFAVGKNLAFKGGLFGVFKVLEFKYRAPNERRTIKWFKVGVGVGFTLLAVRNFRTH